MKELIVSEWERLWSRYVTWILFGSIPFILYATAQYYLEVNLHTSPYSPEYTVMNKLQLAIRLSLIV